MPTRRPPKPPRLTRAHGAAPRARSVTHSSNARLLLVPVVHLLAPAELARAAGRNETHLLTRHRIAAHGRRVADVLVVTTTVRVLDGVHRPPGTASRRTVDGWPMCWWLPPPCGCSTG